MKILHFIYGLTLGGAESFIRSCMKALNADCIEWHFAIQNPSVNNQFFKDNVTPGNIHILPSFTKNPLGQFRALSKLIKTNQFDIVHIHANALINPIPIICCMHLKQRFIIHSHNTATNRGAVCHAVHGVNKVWLQHCTHVKRLACSEIAGRWMFGYKKFTVANNAIDVRNFIFNENGRTQVRSLYGITDDAYVIGTVGRMVEAKNYPFIIALFREYLKIDQSARLLLVGDGPLRGMLEKQTSDISQFVIFAGSQQNTVPFYSAMDCFIAPSFFEGLPIVTVEAQASGLNIIVSNAIPDEVNVSGLVNKLSLADPMEKWLSLLKQPKASNYERVIRGTNLLSCQFDLPYLAKTLRNVYIE